MTRAIVDRLYTAIDADDFDALAQLFHRDAIYERPGGRPLVGRDAIVQFYRRDRRIARGTHAIDHVVIEGDAGAAWGSFSGTRVEGWTLELSFADCFTFEHGTIRTRRGHIHIAAR